MLVAEGWGLEDCQSCHSPPFFELFLTVTGAVFVVFGLMIDRHKNMKSKVIIPYNSESGEGVSFHFSVLESTDIPSSSPWTQS